MAVFLTRHNWGTARAERREVNEAVLQEMVDLLLGTRRLWESHPELFEGKLRQWQQRIDVLPVIETVSSGNLVPANDDHPPEPVLVAAGVEEEDRSEPAATIRALASQGKSVSAIKSSTGLTGKAIRAVLGG